MVLYFFLFLFKFLLAITPPIPNNFFVTFNVLTFLAFILISAFPRIASIGDILDAFIAGIKHDKNIVTAEIAIEMPLLVHYIQMMYLPSCLLITNLQSIVKL